MTYAEKFEKRVVETFPHVMLKKGYDPAYIRKCTEGGSINWTMVPAGLADRVYVVTIGIMLEELLGAKLA